LDVSNEESNLSALIEDGGLELEDRIEMSGHIKKRR
jgi:hypothetical protein